MNSDIHYNLSKVLHVDTILNYSILYAGCVYISIFHIFFIWL